MTNTEIFFRLLLSFVCGTIVGLERQWRHKNAGLKTNTLVAVGATTVTIVAGIGGTFLPQVAAGVVTGIGFIGGGVIMKRGASVQGINSAATLWATASIGLAIGRGYNGLAVLVLLFIVFIQFVERGLANWMDHKTNFVSPDTRYTLEVRFESHAGDLVRQNWRPLFDQAGAGVVRYVEKRMSDSECVFEVVTQISKNKAQELVSIVQHFTAIDGVRSAAWFESSSTEDERE